MRPSSFSFWVVLSFSSPLGGGASHSPNRNLVRLRTLFDLIQLSNKYYATPKEGRRATPHNQDGMTNNQQGRGGESSTTQNSRGVKGPPLKQRRRDGTTTQKEGGETHHHPPFGWCCSHPFFFGLVLLSHVGCCCLLVLSVGWCFSLTAPSLGWWCVPSSLLLGGAAFTRSPLGGVAFSLSLVGAAVCPSSFFGWCGLPPPLAVVLPFLQRN